MIIQVLLGSGLLILLFYAVSQRKKSPFVAYFIALLALAGEFFVGFPNATTSIARILGVGRGTDLILYIFILVTLVVILNLHLQIRANAEVTTKIAKKLAMISANVPPQTESEGGS